MKPLKVVDSHFHTWNLDKQKLYWLDESSPKLRHNFTAEQLLKEYASVGDVEVLGMVHVEADVSDPVLEDEIVGSMLHRVPEVKAFVTHAKLSREMTITPGACGVREVLHTDASPQGRCLQPEFIEGLKVLTARDMSFDAVMRPHELGDLASALEQVPQARVIINHMGNVNELDEQLRSSLRRLASFPNVFCKVSGLAYKQPKNTEELFSFFEQIFGRSRLMYASNWPVIQEYSTLSEHINAVRSYFGDDNNIFKDTAIRAYKLKGLK